MRKPICMFIIAALLLSFLPAFADETPAIEYYGSFEWPRNDATLYDWTGKTDLLYTLEFGTDTKWPDDSKMPETFKKADRDRIMQFGMNPGLGIRKLQSMGYTGIGVSVAIVDQPLLLNHVEYRDRDIRYYKINPDSMENFETSSHGPGMTSILVGKNMGVVPKSTLYFMANPTWLGDQKNEADAFRKIIELNASLPADKKIKVISFSHGVDPSLKNSEMLRQAIDDARKSGIIVVDVTTFHSVPVTCLPFKDKDAATNYQVSVDLDNSSIRSRSDVLFVPTGGKTIANGNYPEHYFYQTNSGVSSTVPYICGVIAMGLQVDPGLTQEKAEQYLRESAYSFFSGKLINPEGFVELVKKNSSNPHDVTKDKDFRYFIYNSGKVSDADLNAIKTYVSQFPVSEEAVLIDASGCKTATELYNMLKAEKGGRKGALKGIQIFGTSGDVPAFEIKYKIVNIKGIDEGGNFKSDHFYSNFNSAGQLDGISIYEVFKSNLKVDFIPEWPVSRLPLSMGEYPDYMRKYDNYVEAVKGKKIPVISFSSPIFASSFHSDDTGILLKRLRDEFKMIDNGSFRLYGNLQGLYPIGYAVTGDFSKESLIRENSAGICNFFINSHGQSDNIDKYIVDKDSNLAKYADKQGIVSLGNSTSTFRQSLVNTGNINTVLSKNYYNIFSRSCNNAYNLDGNNIIHEAMVKGMLITAIANSDVNSNNGMDVTADLEGLKKNNPAYNFMIYTYSLLSGNNASRSFCIAKSAYVQEVLNHKEISASGGNYQYQLHNVLVQSFLGLLEYTEDKNVPMSELLPALRGSEADEGKNTPNSIDYDGKIYEIPMIISPQKSTLSFADDGYAYCPVSNKIRFMDPRYKLSEFSAAVDMNNVFIKVKLTSPKIYNASIRLAGDAPGLSERYTGGIVKGNNVIIVKISKQKLKQFTASMCLEVGDEYSILIDKKLTDQLAGIQTDSKFFAAPGIRLGGKLVYFNQDTGYPYKDVKGNILAPFSAAMKAIGAEISVEGEKNTLLAVRKGITIEFPPGSNYIYRNGNKVSLSVNTTVIGGIVYIPLKIFIENFGDKYSYNKNLGVSDIIPVNK